MDKSQTNDLIVTYTDGTHDHFKFPSQADGFNMANIVEKLLSSSSLALQVGDRLLIIPTASIRNVEVSPCPGKLPDIVMRNVERLPRTW
jgi:hypothetical protein